VQTRLAAGVPASAGPNLLAETRRLLGSDLLIEGDVHRTDRDDRTH